MAQYQKGILVCILAYLMAVLSQFALPVEVRLFLALGVVAVGIAGMIFVFLLAARVYGIGLGILLDILALIPCIGLIVLLVVNGRATAILRQNGIKVGLLGADLSQTP